MFPLTAAAALTLLAGFRNEGAWPKYGLRSIVSFGVLLIVFGAVEGTRLRPVSQAISWLIFLGVAFATIPQLSPGNDPVDRTRR